MVGCGTGPPASVTPETRTSVAVANVSVLESLRLEGVRLLPFDLDRLLRTSLAEDRRPPDGRLHASSDLTGPLRHTQLHAAGVPTIESETASDVRLMTGTLWHTYFERIFRGSFTACEVKLDEFLPEGWSGTADWITWNADRRAFVLGDLKTIKPEGLTYIQTEGIKREHQHQVSLYWYALANMGLPLVKGYVVYYLPTGPIIGDTVEPLLQEGTPLDEGYLMELANSRRQQVDAYLQSMQPWKGTRLTAELAPEPEKELRLMWNKAVSRAGGVETPGWELKNMPVWQTMFCPFDNAYCSCSEQRPEKIGHWTYDADGVMRFSLSRGKTIPGGQEPVAPTKAQQKRLLEAHKKAKEE